MKLLILVLIFLLVGSLMITPLLNQAGTLKLTTDRHTERTKEFYSADSGIDYALYHITQAHREMSEITGNHSFTLNDKDVEVTIEEIEAREDCEGSYYLYRIASECESQLVTAYVNIEVAKYGVAERRVESTILSYVIGVNEPG